MERSFSTEVDSISDGRWSSLLDQFADASLYQTLAYGRVRWGEGRLSHLVLAQGGRVMGMAQVLIVGSSRVRAGMAYLRAGPLWRRKGEPEDVSRLESIASALIDEYVVRRGLFLKIVPNACLGTSQGAAFERALSRFREEAFLPGESYRSIVLDLGLPLDALRKRLDQKWRNQLNRAERNGLVILEGQSAEDFARYARIHDEMLARKRFTGASDVREFERMQSLLQERQKMHVLICQHEGRDVAGIVTSSIGDTGIYLLGATSNEGMQSKGSYLLQWRMIERLKEAGVARYDLNGINPDTNPGVYHFKAGFGGDDCCYLRPRTLCNSLASTLLARAERAARGSFRQRLTLPWRRS